MREDSGIKNSKPPINDKKFNLYKIKFDLLLVALICIMFVSLSTSDTVEPDELQLLKNCTFDEVYWLHNYTEWNFFGNQLLEEHKYKRALCRYNMSIKLNPDFIDSWNNRGVAFSYLGRNEDALKSYDKALEIDPENSIVWNNKGAILSKMGRYNDSIRCLEKAIDLNSKNVASWNNKGVVLYKMDDFDDALNSFNKSISLNLYSAEAWNNRGAIFAEMGNYNEALYCFKNAAMINQNLTEPWINGGMVLSILGELNKSERSFSIARKLGFREMPREYLMIAEFSPIIDPQENSGVIEILSEIIKSIPQKISNWRIDLRSTIYPWPRLGSGPYEQ